MKALQFDKPCIATLLEDEIIAAGLPKPTRFLGITSDPDGDVKAPRVVVFLPDDVTDDEIKMVQGTVTAHDLLAGARAARIAALRAACRAYIFAQYDDGTQASLNALFTAAVSRGYTNRVAKIGLALDWIDGCLDYYYGVKDAIMVSDAPDSATWDFSRFDGTIPDVSLRAVRDMDN